MTRTNEPLDLEVVDAIIAEQRIAHDAGKCNREECVWCPEYTETLALRRVKRPPSTPAPSTRAPNKRFNTGPRTAGYKKWLASKAGGKRKKKRRR